MKAQSMSY